MKSYAYAVAFIAVVLLLAHLVVGEPYQWQLNSISQLAAQTYEHAWIMRVGFIGFGILIQIAAVGRLREARRYWYREAPIMLYGLAILLSGLFSTSPFVEGAPFSEQEAQLHTVFATVAGIALSMGILFFALTDAPKSRRIVHGLALLAVMGLSLLFNALPAGAGAVQRLLWVAGFAWLIFLGSSAIHLQDNDQHAQ